MEPILRLNEFFVEGGKQNLSHVLLHITEPSTPEETKKGYFFALCEINNSDDQQIKKFQDLIDRADNEYYELNADLKDPFELILEKINSESFTITNSGEINCIIGALRQKEIIFSYSGSPHLLLFYKNKTGGFQRMDLIKNDEEEKPASNQLFSQIVQGKLSHGDFLFAGTTHITDFFSHDRLEKIITGRTASESAEHIEKVLGELKNGYSFGGLIINLFKPEPAAEAPKKMTVSTATPSESSSKSLQNLFTRERTTAETLSPSLLPKLDKIKKILGNEEDGTSNPQAAAQKKAEINSSHVSTRQTRVASSRENFGDKATKIWNVTLAVLKVVGQWLLGLLILILGFFKQFLLFFQSLFFIIFNFRNKRALTIGSWKQGWRGFLNNIRRLPFITKLMLVSSVLLAAGFVVSVIFIHRHQVSLAAEQAFNKDVSEIRSKKDTIDSAIIYKNDELASSEYALATQKLSRLDCTSKNHQEICNSLKADLDGLSYKMQKITLTTSTVITTWDELASDKTASIVRLKNKIIAYSNNTSTLFVYDLLSGDKKTISTYPSIFGFSEATVPKENDYALFLYNKKQLLELDPTDLSVHLADISFPLDQVNLSAISVYSRRLYAIDSGNTTIFRSEPIKTGFGQGKEWLKTKEPNLSGSTDLTIDGDLYVPKDNGQILKFTSGQSATFDVSGVTPAFTSGLKLWTYVDVPYIYALDSTGKRLVIIDKNGSLVSQVTSQNFSYPSGFSIDSAARTAYILDSGKLEKISLPQ